MPGLITAARDIAASKVLAHMEPALQWGRQTMTRLTKKGQRKKDGRGGRRQRGEGHRFHMDHFLRTKGQ